jgi:putative ABC transport system permease protein
VADADRPGSPCVLVVNETYVERYLGAREPVGTRLVLAPRGSAIPCEIAGVASDLRFNTLAEPPDPTVYLPIGQFPNRRFFVILRTSGDPMALLPGAREAVAAVDPGLAVWSPLPMTSLVSETLRTPRQVAVLVGAFAVLALLLAASGVYGVATYNVNARLREFGVRTALGARQVDLLWQVLVGGLWLVGSGMAAGVLLTIAFGRLLGSLLYEVEPFDLQVFGCVALLLVAAAMLAMLLPARRAARVQPMEALRYE